MFVEFLEKSTQKHSPALPIFPLKHRQKPRLTIARITIARISLVGARRNGVESRAVQALAVGVIEFSIYGLTNNNNAFWIDSTGSKHISMKSGRNPYFIKFINTVRPTRGEPVRLKHSTTNGKHCIFWWTPRRLIPRWIPRAWLRMTHDDTCGWVVTGAEHHCLQLRCMVGVEPVDILVVVTVTVLHSLNRCGPIQP